MQDNWAEKQYGGKRRRTADNMRRLTNRTDKQRCSERKKGREREREREKEKEREIER